MADDFIELKKDYREMVNSFEAHIEMMRMEGHIDGNGYQQTMDLIREMKGEMQW